jgi:O-antigen ligase
VAVLASGLVLSWANSVRYRLEFHRLGIRMFVDHPLLGLGAEGFRRQYGAYQQSGLFDPQQFPQLATTHSSFLEVLVNWGVPGIVCFAGALLWIFKRPGLVIRRRLAEGTAVPVLGLWLGLLAFVINAASENLFSFSKLEAVFWTLSALLMRLAAEESTRIRTGTR